MKQQNWKIKLQCEKEMLNECVTMILSEKTKTLCGSQAKRTRDISQ